MEKKEKLWERLAPIVLEGKEGFGDITVGGATDQQGKDNLLNFISQELDKARGDGKAQQLLDLIALFGEWEHPLQFDNEYVQEFLQGELSKLN